MSSDAKFWEPIKIAKMIIFHEHTMQGDKIQQHDKSPMVITVEHNERDIDGEQFSIIERTTVYIWFP